MPNRADALSALAMDDLSSQSVAGSMPPQPPAGAPLAALGDQELMSRVRLGDEAAYRTLVERHINRMYRLAGRILSDRHACEDVVQEAFVQLWVRRAEWQQTSAQVSTWLYRVVLNRCLDIKRRRREVAMDGEDTRQDDGPDAVTSIHRDELSAALRHALESLPENQYTAVTMFYHEGCSAREAADVLGVSINAFESLLKRARQDLRDRLRVWRNKTGGSVFES
jgi:RNA polymerase sigma-70 factor (ECF subfamily)